MTELDTSEVIMNSVVKAPEDSDFPKMHLAMVDGDESAHAETPIVYQPDAGTTTATLTIAFVNPYSTDEFPEKNDLQFVIQLEDSSGGAPGVSGEFVDGGTIGCEGNQRVSARYRDDKGRVQLQIHDTSASFKMWAGWATGQSAVRLTPTMILEPGAPNQEGEKVTEDKSGKQDGKQDTDQEKYIQANDKDQEAARRDKESLEQHDKIENQDNADKGQKQEGQPETASGKNDEAIVHKAEAVLEAEKKIHDNVPSRRDNRKKKKTEFDEKRHYKDLTAEMERNFPDKKSFVRRYEAGLELDSSSHLLASIFFLISIGGILFCFRNQRAKGHLL